MTDQPTITDLPTYDQIDRLVNEDPLKLRDLAWALRREVERLRAAAPHIAAQHSTDLEAALDSARNVIALSSRDWSTSHDLAWLWGILVGWDEDPTAGDVDQGDAMTDLAARHRWSPGDVARLRRLRAAIDLAGRPGSSPTTRTTAEQPGPRGCRVCPPGCIECTYDPILRAMCRCYGTAGHDEPTTRAEPGDALRNLARRLLDVTYREMNRDAADSDTERASGWPALTAAADALRDHLAGQPETRTTSTVALCRSCWPGQGCNQPTQEPTDGR